MRMKLKYLFAIIATFLFVGFIGIYFIAPYAILQPPRTSLSIDFESLDLKGKKIQIDNGTSILKGYQIDTKRDSVRGSMILIHGIGGCKEHFIGLAEKLGTMGISSFLFDLRGHGESEEKYLTFGFKEKKDFAKVVDFIKNENPELPIGIWGNSLGGAVAIQTLEYDEQIDFGVIESTFHDLNQIVFDYKKRILKGFGIRFVSDFGLKRAGEIGGFDPQKIKPIESVKNIEQPVLIAHGTADKNISFEYGKLLFENLKSKEKVFVPVEGGGHEGLFRTGGEAYGKAILDFIESNLE